MDEERVLLRVAPCGALAAQGLSEVSFESDEPAFDELDPSDFLERFPMLTSLTITDARVGPADDVETKVLASAIDGNQAATESSCISAD